METPKEKKQEKEIVVGTFKETSEELPSGRVRVTREEKTVRVTRSRQPGRGA